jgi:hypothetical protein
LLLLGSKVQALFLLFFNLVLLQFLLNFLFVFNALDLSESGCFLGLFPLIFLLLNAVQLSLLAGLSLLLRSDLLSDRCPWATFLALSSRRLTSRGLFCGSVSFCLLSCSTGLVSSCGLGATGLCCGFLLGLEFSL